MDVNFEMLDLFGAKSRAMNLNELKREGDDLERQEREL